LAWVGQAFLDVPDGVLVHVKGARRMSGANTEGEGAGFRVDPGQARPGFIPHMKHFQLGAVHIQPVSQVAFPVNHFRGFLLRQRPSPLAPGRAFPMPGESRFVGE
jgi:hypothetical protein